MSVFCGGFKIGAGLKLINGVICDADATTVDRSKAITGCGQLWDGALFTMVDMGGRKVITLHNSEGDAVGTPIIMRGSCGVGLDARFFKLENRIVSLQDGFVLTVNVTPADSTIKVTDADGAAVQPVTDKIGVYLLIGLGDTYTVEVSKTGYTTQTKTITNNGDQTIDIVLVTA